MGSFDSLNNETYLDCGYIMSSYGTKTQNISSSVNTLIVQGNNTFYFKFHAKRKNRFCGRSEKYIYIFNHYASVTGTYKNVKKRKNGNKEIKIVANDGIPKQVVPTRKSSKIYLIYLLAVVVIIIIIIYLFIY